MKKVILIRSYGLDASINKIATSLSQNGFDVHLLVWDRQHKLYNSGNKKFTVHTFNLKAPYDKMSIIFYHPFWWLYEFYFLMTNKCDIIHACDLDTLYPAILVKLIKRIKLYYIIYDFYANNVNVHNNNIILKNIKSLIAWAEKRGIGYIDALFLTDETRIEEVKGAKIKKVVYLYNSPPDSFHQKRMLQHSSNKFVIFFAGIIQKVRGIEYMVKAIENLDNFEMVIAGSDDLSHLSIPLSDNLKNKVHYIGWINYDLVLEKTMASDVLFRFVDPKSPTCIYGSPNKLFEAMMCGKPIIMNVEMGASRIVLAENCGITVPYGDVEAIKRALVQIKEDPVFKNCLGENGRRAFLEKYSWEIMEKRLLDVYQNT